MAPLQDDPVTGRSIRFALTVLTPVLLGLFIAGSAWLPYGLLGVAAFVVLVLETASLAAGQALPLLEERVLDAALGGGFALLTLGLE